RTDEEQRRHVARMLGARAGLERRAVGADVLVKAGHRIDGRGDQHVVALAAGELGGLGAVGGDSYRRMRPLERPRLDRDVGDLVKAALVGEALTGPCAHDYFQRLLEALAALVARHPEALEVDRDRAAPDAVLQAA